MPTPAVWFYNNDMVLQLDRLQSSTMSSTAYLNSSTGVTVTVWKSYSTNASTNRIVTAKPLPYVVGSNGRYRARIESTSYTMAQGIAGVAIFTLNALGLNGEWRMPFHVDFRQTT